MKKDIRNEIDITALTEEYIMLQKLIDSFDLKSLTIKAWSITISMSGIGAAFISHSSILFILSSLSALIFWILEFGWKKFQYYHFARIYEIENWMNKSNKKEFHLFQMTNSFKQQINSLGLKKSFNLFTLYHVMVPHILIFIIGILLYVLFLYDLIKI